jgi:hypothetical protein
MKLLFCFQMPNCIDYTRYLSKAAARRQPSAIREASKQHSFFSLNSFE